MSLTKTEENTTKLQVKKGKKKKLTYLREQTRTFTKALLSVHYDEQGSAFCMTHLLYQILPNHDRQKENRDRLAPSLIIFDRQRVFFFFFLCAMFSSSPLLYDFNLFPPFELSILMFGCGNKDILWTKDQNDEVLHKGIYDISPVISTPSQRKGCNWNEIKN